MSDQENYVYMGPFNEGSPVTFSSRLKKRQYLERLSNQFANNVPSPSREKRCEEVAQRKSLNFNNLSLGDDIFGHVDHTYLRNQEVKAGTPSDENLNECSIDKEKLFTIDQISSSHKDINSSLTLKAPNFSPHDHQPSIPLVEECSDPEETVEDC